MSPGKSGHLLKTKNPDIASLYPGYML